MIKNIEKEVQQIIKWGDGAHDFNPIPVYRRS